MILALMAAAAVLQSGDDLKPKELAELDDLRADVRLLGLLNALQLTKDQTKELLECAQQAREKADALVKDNADLMAAARKSLEAMKAALEKGETVTEEMRAEIARTEREAQAKILAAQAEIAPLAKKARGLLDDRQIGLVLRFDPTGKRRDPLAAEKEKVRQGLMNAYTVTKDDIAIGVDRAVSQLEEKTGKLSDEDRAAECERLEKIVLRAQDMSEEELAKNVDGMVEEIFTKGKFGEVLAKASGAAAKDRQPDRAVAETFFTPRAIRLLEKRAE